MSRKFLKSYLLNLFTIFSQFLNCLLLAGSPDQTISARCYMNRNKKYWSTCHKVLDFLFFWQNSHCELSYRRDVVNSKSLLRTGRFPEA